MSIQDSASALVAILADLGLPKLKADTLRKMKLGSSLVFSESVDILHNLIIYIQDSHKMNHFEYIFNDEKSQRQLSANGFLLSKCSPLYIQSNAIDSTCTNLVILLWCFSDISFSILFGMRFFNNVPIPNLRISECHLSAVPIESSKSCLQNIACILSALSIKEAGINLSSKALFKFVQRLYFSFPTHLISSLQREFTLLETLHILDSDSQLGVTNQNLRKFKHFVDSLTKWYRNSSAFFRWLRLPPHYDNSTQMSECIFEKPNEESIQNLHKYYSAIQKRKFILTQYIPHIENMTTDISRNNIFAVQKEFSERLNFVSESLKAPPYVVHPMESFSVASELSSVTPSFDPIKEKQILQSMISLLKSQVELKKNTIHSRIKESYHDILPNVSCIHKNV